MRGIDNKKFFMTLEEFENLVNKENNELINGKKLLLMKKYYLKLILLKIILSK